MRDVWKIFLSQALAAQASRNSHRIWTAIQVWCMQLDVSNRVYTGRAQKGAWQWRRRLRWWRKIETFQVSHLSKVLHSVAGTLFLLLSFLVALGNQETRIIIFIEAKLKRFRWTLTNKEYCKYYRIEWVLIAISLSG